VQLPSDLAERCADVIPIIMLVMGFAKGSTHPAIVTHRMKKPRTTPGLLKTMQAINQYRATTGPPNL
jgi:hypothetical protein